MDRPFKVHWNVVTCDGSQDGGVKTVCDWVPATIPNPDPLALEDSDPNNDFILDVLDVPPLEVIVEEKCSAKYDGFYFVGGSGSGSCDNDLGFEEATGWEPVYIYSDPDSGSEEQELIGFSYWGESKGTLYTKMAGTATIELIREPDARTQVSMGSCFASVWYSSRIYVPKIATLGVERFASPSHSLRFITGQKVTASLSLAAGGPTPVGDVPVIDQTSYDWSFEAETFDPFKNFTWSNNNGDKVDLLTSDYKQSTLGFYTVKDGTSKVLCSFKVTLPSGSLSAGGLPNISAESKPIISVRPEYINWTLQSGTVFLYNNAIWCGPGGGSPEGQDWSNVEFRLPAPYQQVGQGSFCLLITPTRDLYRYVVPPGGYTHFIKDGPQGVQALDKNFPYNVGNNYLWTISGKGAGHDSPSNPLTLSAANTDYWYQSTADDSFETWAMYKPPSHASQPTVWIPMAKYTWDWSGDATRSSATSAWSLTKQDPNPSSPGVNYVHPEWNLFSWSPFNFHGIP